MMLNEVLLNNLKDKELDFYLSEEGYQDRFNHIKRNSNLAKAKKYSGGVGEQDLIQLGQQFKMFENYVSFCETIGSSSELGDTPKIGLDIITGIAANSIVPFVGGTQNMKDEEGFLYFDRVKAGSTRGNMTAGQIIRDPRQAAQAYQRGYATENQGPTAVSATAVGVTIYNIALPQAPVKPGTLELIIPGMGNIEALDRRDGKIIGDGISGVINYASGTISLQLAAVPGGIFDIVATYKTDFEVTGNVPLIQTDLDKINVKAEIVALRGQTSIYKNYAMQMRFGQQASANMVNKLINEITAEINYKVADQCLAAAVGETRFDPIPRFEAVAQTLHIQEFMNMWRVADQQIRTNAGKGAIQTILAGDQVCTAFSMIPAYSQSRIVADGPHVHGTIDGITVIRCPHYDPLIAVGLFRGMGMFDTGFLYGPFMPLYVDGSIPSPQNILVKEGLVTTWAAFKTVVPRYFTKFRLLRAPGSNY